MDPKDLFLLTLGRFTLILLGWRSDMLRPSFRMSVVFNNSRKWSLLYLSENTYRPWHLSPPCSHALVVFPPAASWSKNWCLPFLPSGFTHDRYPNDTSLWYNSQAS
uniref:Uncharacterized protein n=1 Tax=Morchella importuna TaxID=1174673 RepID=A0A650AFD6_9PEZI|nr:hypothetical protein [Morchella importuna]QGN66755.1 hypothetical protein [Morchella importuna]